MNNGERRQHRRLAIRLPLEYCLFQAGRGSLVRSVSHDVSSGGVSFETDGDPIAVGTNLTVDLIVPPGDGYFPYTGRVRGDGEVVRVEPSTHPGASPGADKPRFRVAARFRDALELQF